MSTTISCRVDTKPMAEELHSVSNHVKGTTAAAVMLVYSVVPSIVSPCKLTMRAFTIHR